MSRVGRVPFVAAGLRVLVEELPERLAVRCKQESVDGFESHGSSLRERVRVGVVRLARLEPVLAELLRDRIEALPAERPIAVAHEQRIQARYDDADDREAERADIRCRQVAGDRLEPPPLELTRHRAKRLRRGLVPAVGQVVEADRLRRGPAELGERLRTLRAVEAEMLHLMPHRRTAELDLDWELRRALHHLLGAPARSRELLEALDERPA